MRSTTILSTRHQRVAGHLVKLARKGFAELQGSSMLQPQQVTAFPAEHMLTIVMYGLRPNASKPQIRVCACLAAQFAFFSRADSGVLLTAVNAQVSNSTFLPSSYHHGLPFDWIH
jgi:hypothetical protein